MLSILSCALAVDKLREQVKVLEQKIQVLENR
jgi:hypothetical protein